MSDASIDQEEIAECLALVRRNIYPVKTPIVRVTDSWTTFLTSQDGKLKIEACCFGVKSRDVEVHSAIVFDFLHEFAEEGIGAVSGELDGVAFRFIRC